ncbi:MAG: dihydrodipicolinate synthase family protein [Eubacteriales bacterium]|nr:dihydrodipicolinate synthase family protein [Eubacteriales bacterium]
MDRTLLKGIIVPIITPIDQDEQVNEAKLRQQVDFVIEGGVSGILAFGSNGEFYMTEEAEQEKVLSIILEHTAGRVPVFQGIGAISTKKCIRIAKMAERLGVDAISILQPMFLKPTEEELYKHFKAIADSVPNLSVLLYNNPGRTGYTMSGNLVERLAHEVPNVIGMKDSSGDMTQTAEFIRRNRDVDFKVFGGKDTLIYSALCVGAAGSVCTTANFIPKLICSVYDAYVAGDQKESLELQFKLNPIRLAMDKSSFPVATKDYCNLLGLDVGAPYLPNLPASGAGKEALVQELTKAGYLS